VRWGDIQSRSELRVVEIGDRNPVRAMFARR
jgi:hypothetical protein